MYTIEQISIQIGNQIRRKIYRYKYMYCSYSRCTHMSQCINTKISRQISRNRIHTYIYIQILKQISRYRRQLYTIYICFSLVCLAPEFFMRGKAQSTENVYKATYKANSPRHHGYPGTNRPRGRLGFTRPSTRLVQTHQNKVLILSLHIHYTVYNG